MTGGSPRKPDLCVGSERQQVGATAGLKGKYYRFKQLRERRRRREQEDVVLQRQAAIPKPLQVLPYISASPGVRLRPWLARDDER